MNLDDIRTSWLEDCKIDTNDLDTENFKVTVIHEKYLMVIFKYVLDLLQYNYIQKVML